MNNRRTKAEWRSRRETYLRESGRHLDLVAEGFLKAERRLFVVINGGRLVREHVEEVARSASPGSSSAGRRSRRSAGRSS